MGFVQLAVERDKERRRQLPAHDFGQRTFDFRAS
jgi:hypothetical protein